MGERSMQRGERLSRTYQNPEFDFDRDQETTAMLVGDIRRVMLVGIVGVALFSAVLALTGGPNEGLTLMMIVGAPLGIVLAIGELVRRRSRRGRIG